ncbi:mitochondrial respiratory chain complex I assembly [Homalodisca vitripennis]|nr:mitochondrial respiratory chain complex I assembly [Homalodisca vitripennis]
MCMRDLEAVCWRGKVPPWVPRATAVKTVVEPNRKEYHWYHQKFRRVPTVDQCYDDDPVCKWEAMQQFHRDQYVCHILVKLILVLANFH